jgi:hypothetical protein
MAQAETRATVATMNKILNEARETEQDAMNDDRSAREQLLAAEARLSKSKMLSADEVDAAELMKSEAIKHQISASLKLQAAQHKRQMLRCRPSLPSRRLPVSVPLPS